MEYLQLQDYDKFLYSKEGKRRRKQLLLLPDSRLGDICTASAASEKSLAARTSKKCPFQFPEKKKREGIFLADSHSERGIITNCQLSGAVVAEVTTGRERRKKLLLRMGEEKGNIFFLPFSTFSPFAYIFDCKKKSPGCSFLQEKEFYLESADGLKILILFVWLLEQIQSII